MYMHDYLKLSQDIVSYLVEQSLVTGYTVDIKPDKVVFANSHSTVYITFKHTHIAVQLRTMTPKLYQCEHKKKFPCWGEALKKHLMELLK